MAGMGRFELPTNWFVARYSIQLSYIPACIALFLRIAALLQKPQPLTYVWIYFELDVFSRLALHKTTQFKRRLKHLYVKNGGDGKIRTPDQLVRSQVLYPTELHPRRMVRLHLVI